MRDKNKFVRVFAIASIFIVAIVFIIRVFFFDDNDEVNKSLPDEPISTIIYDTTKTGYAKNIYISNNQVESEGKIINGLKDSIWNFYTEGGTKKGYTNFKSGKRSGVYVKYHPDGKTIKQKGYYIDDVINGVVEFYFENGYISDRFVYKNGVKEGKYEGFDYIQSNNKQFISKSGFYKNEKKHGEWKYFDYYYDIKSKTLSNKLILTGLENYKDGELHGKWIEYDPQYGFKLIETEYKNGLEDGLRKSYCPNGPDARKLWTIDEYKDGNVVKKYPYQCDCY